MTPEHRGIRKARIFRVMAIASLTAITFGICTGVLTDAIDTPFFRRLSPTHGIDYPIWIINSSLVGILTGASYYARQNHHIHSNVIVSGGFLATFALSCPLCNGLIVGMFGSAIAATIVDPARPFVGAFVAILMFVQLCRHLHGIHVNCKKCAGHQAVENPDGSIPIRPTTV